MKILARNKFPFPIHVLPNDSISLEYVDPHGIRHNVLQEPINEAHVFTEGIIFELDADQCKNLGVSYGLGGAFLE